MLGKLVIWVKKLTSRPIRHKKGFNFDHFRHEHINQELLKSRGIKAGYTPGVLTNDVADHNICLTLSVLRRVKELIG